MKKLTFVMIFLLFGALVLSAQTSRVEVGSNLGLHYLFGDSPVTSSIPQVGANVFASYLLMPDLRLMAEFGMESVKIKQQQAVSYLPIRLMSEYTIGKLFGTDLFLRAGAGIFFFSGSHSDRTYHGLATTGIGSRIPISSGLHAAISANFTYTTVDNLNGTAAGSLGDGFFSLQGGIAYNLGKQKVFEKKEKPEKTEIVAQLNQAGKDQGTAISSTKAPGSDNVLETVQLRSQIEKLQTELVEKDAEIEELKTLIKIKNQKIELYEKQLAELKRQPQPQNLYKERPNATSRPYSSSASVKQQYQAALNKFYGRRYKEAIADFSRLAEDYPGHSLYGNFLYWIGECYYGLGNIGAALESFNQVSKLSRSHKLDDALLMAGICYMKLGNAEKAKEKFRQLIAKYPQSEYVGKAKQYLQSLEREAIS